MKTKLMPCDYGYEGGASVPVVLPDYCEPEPAVPRTLTRLPLLARCQRPFAKVWSGDLDALPMLHKRLEVLAYALREALDGGDFPTVRRLAGKAVATQRRLAEEAVADAFPTRIERRGSIVIHDDAERRKVLIQFPSPLPPHLRRKLQTRGFCGSGDRMTYWRKRTIRHGENVGLNAARDLLESLGEPLP